MDELLTTPCEWMVLCFNPTANAANHPIIGLVPVCDRCATRFELEVVAMAVAK